MLNFSHHITTATPSLSLSLSCHPSGALFNPSIAFPLLFISQTLFLSFRLSSRHVLLSFPLSPNLLYFSCPQLLYFYELRDSVLLINIFLWCRTELVTGAAASRSTAHTHTEAARRTLISCCRMEFPLSVDQVVLTHA